MKHLKITCKLLDGRVNSSDGLFQLDSILAWAWMRENHPELLGNSDPAKNDLIDPSLPLLNRGGRWAASSGFYVQHGEYKEHWHKRFRDKLAGEYVDFRGKRGKVNTTAGGYKAYRMPQIIRLVSDIHFYAVGDRGEVSRLLNTYVTNIGKKSSQGYGAVNEWIVEEWHEDWSEIGPYGYMRPTPFNPEAELTETYQIRPFGVKPPYWLQQHQTVCFIPNVRRETLI